MLIAAIDPQAEARLDGLNHALTSGQYLPENFGNANPRAGFGKAGGVFPVLAAADSGIGEYAVTQVAGAARAPRHRRCSTRPRCQGRHGTRAPVLGNTITARQAYQYLLSALGGHRQAGHLQRARGVLVRPGELPAVSDRRAPGPSALVPAAVRNPDSVWDPTPTSSSPRWTTPIASTGRCGSTPWFPTRQPR